MAILRDSKGRFLKGSKFNHTRQSWVCRFCSKSFQTKDYVKRVFCSKECYINGSLKNPDSIKNRAAGRLGVKRTNEQRLKVSRENHYNWKGGITSEERLQRIKFRRYFQHKVFERDNYTCVLCKSVGGKLQVDHIKSWSQYRELRFVLSNCRTLCMKCHYLVTFGKPMPEHITAWGHNLERGVAI